MLRRRLRRYRYMKVLRACPFSLHSPCGHAGIMKFYNAVIGIVLIAYPAIMVNA